MKKKESKKKWIKKFSFLLGIVFLLIGNIQLSEAGSGNYMNEANVISLKLKNASLYESLREIEALTDYKFNYVKSELESVSLNINLNLEEGNILELLKMISNQTGVEFMRINDIIAVNTSNSKKINSNNKTGFQDEITISGDVKDENGNPLAGATVLIKGTNKGVTTNSEGKYEIKAPSDVALIVSFIGYEDREMLINGNKSINFTLTTAKTALDEVVVTGYLIPTEIRKIDVPIAVVRNEELLQSPVRNMFDVFRSGRVPGVLSLDRGWFVNTPTSVRGGTQFSGLNNTKTYINGIQVSSPNVWLAILDKHNIGKIEITRGPAASTMYGSDATGGLFEIFTKRGEEGTQFSVSTSGGFIESKYIDGVAPTQEHSINFGGGKQDMHFNIGAGYRTDGEWVDEHFLKNGGLFGTFDGKMGKFESLLTLQYLQRTYGKSRQIFQDIGLPMEFPVNQDYLVTSQLLGGMFTYNAADFWKHTLTLGYEGMEYSSFNPVPPGQDSLIRSNSFNFYQTTSVRYHTALVYPREGAFKSTVLLGVEAVNTQQKGYSIGQGYEELYGTNKGTNTVTREDYTNYGYFVQWQPEIANRVYMTLGVRAEDHEFFGKDYGMSVNPRFGITTNFLIGKALIKPRFSYGSAIKAPTRAQLGGYETATSVYVRNADLKPESQLGWDAGLNIYMLKNKLEFEVTYYAQESNDLIFSEILDETESDLVHERPTMQIVMARNVGIVTNNGLELFAKYNMKPFSISGSLTNFMKCEVTRLSEQYSGTLMEGDRILGIPEFSGGGNITYNFESIGFGKGGYLSFDLVYIGERKGRDINGEQLVRYGLEEAGERGTPGSRGFWIDYKSVTEFNFSISYNILSNLEFTARVRNLTNNQDPEQTNDFEQPGRTWIFGLNYNFKK